VASVAAGATADFSASEAIAITSNMTAVAIRVQFSSAGCVITSDMTANGRKLWEPEPIDAETWTPYSLEEQAWTPLNVSAEDWTPVVPASQSWTVLPSGSDSWQRLN
jgi:hypothetical protein